MSENQQTLEDLLVDEEELNEELLAEVLSEYIQIGNESGSIIAQPKFKELDSQQKVVVVLLAQKARKELGLAESEWIGPTAIAEASGIKKGTVYPAAKAIEEEHNLADNEDGQYTIPTYNLNKAREFIRGETQ